MKNSKERIVPMLENYKDIMTPNDLYDILPLGKNKIYEFLRNNAIKNKRIGNKIMIPKQSVIEFLNI